MRKVNHKDMIQPKKVCLLGSTRLVKGEERTKVWLDGDGWMEKWPDREGAEVVRIVDKEE